MSTSWLCRWISCKTLPVKRSLRLAWWMWVVLMVLAWLLGQWTYGCLLEQAYAAQRRALMEQDAVCSALAKAPTLLGPASPAGDPWASVPPKRCTVQPRPDEGIVLDDGTLRRAADSTPEDLRVWNALEKRLATPPKPDVTVSEVQPEASASVEGKHHSVVPPHAERLAYLRIHALLDALQLLTPEERVSDFTVARTRDDSRWGLVFSAVLEDDVLARYVSKPSHAFEALPTPLLISQLAVALKAAQARKDLRKGEALALPTQCGGDNSGAFLVAHSIALAAVLGFEPAATVNARHPRPIGQDYIYWAHRHRPPTGGTTQPMHDPDNSPSCADALDTQVLGPERGLWRLAFIGRAPARVSDGQILQAMLAHFGVVTEAGWGRGVKEGASRREQMLYQQQIQAATTLMAALMSEARTPPRVRAAMAGVTFMRGSEQAAMLVVAYLLLLALLTRCAATHCLNSGHATFLERIDKGFRTAWEASYTPPSSRLRTQTPIKQHLSGSLAAASKHEAIKPDWDSENKDLDPSTWIEAVYASVEGLTGNELRDALRRQLLMKWIDVWGTDQKRERSFVAFVASSLAGAALKVPATPDQANEQVRFLRELVASEEDAQHIHAWFLRFLLAALPAIGFLGTVNGIMSALSNIDAISRVPAGPLQAIEVTFVAGELGLAFATTAIALFAGLVLRWVCDAEFAYESGRLHWVRTTMDGLLHADLWTPGAGPATPTQETPEAEPAP